ncbi:hypothetical protein KPSA3_02969 [Pseudomonas syringae pv. actinidiae]|uniref:Uncharacterized protein n=1 Tax=Pseudomonas syringae pv. actinidiae TaxID=103796 RepID=A0AAN4TKU0_PSESF|nr:hypothetical protein KPSA3_02969 [Pseudomonas syringae pv. actinidiae]
MLPLTHQKGPAAYFRRTLENVVNMRLLHQQDQVCLMQQFAGHLLRYMVSWV